MKGSGAKAPRPGAQSQEGGNFVAHFLTARTRADEVFPYTSQCPMVKWSSVSMSLITPKMISVIVSEMGKLSKHNVLTKGPKHTGKHIEDTNIC